jgi:hypothetical protein
MKCLLENLGTVWEITTRWSELSMAFPLHHLQCFLWPQIAASLTVATPLSMKNTPIRVRPSLLTIGESAYMWNAAMRPKAPRTPSERAITTGTPYFGSPYRRGAYAKEVHGEAKALCHVSDLHSQNHYRKSFFPWNSYQNPVKLSILYSGPKRAGLLLYRSNNCKLVQMI